MAKTAFTNGRAINLDITGADVPIDGIKALLEKIQEFEDRIAAGESITTIAPGSEILVVATSKTQYTIYIFELSATFSSGDYVATWVETAPNVETATTSGIG